MAVSRAKEQIWLFHSVELDDLVNKEDLRYKLLSYFKEGYKRQPIICIPVKRNDDMPLPEPFESWFEVDVYNDLVREGYKVIPQYKVGNIFRIDLVIVLSNGVKLGIECDGDKYHGAEQFFYDINREKILRRLGWEIFRIRGYEYYTNRKKVLSRLSDVIKKFIEEEKRDYEYLEKEKLVFLNKKELKESEIQTHIKKEEVSDRIIKYFFLYKNGEYYLSKNNVYNDADFVLNIKEFNKNDFILQCYKSGHINKINISTLLSKNNDRKYLNGLNVNDELVSLEISNSEDILCIFYLKNNKWHFKAHHVNKISTRDKLCLKGIKVMYTDYERIFYEILSKEIGEKIKRLIFTSFTAEGKPLSNDYYNKEWEIIKSVTKYKELFMSKNNIEINNFLKKIVDKDSIVTLKYLELNKIKIIKLVEDDGNINKINQIINNEYDIEHVSIHKPIAKAILGKREKEIVEIPKIGKTVEILEVK